jgi:hypothetical protein
MNRTNLQFALAGALISFLIGFFVGRITGPDTDGGRPADGARVADNPNARALEALDQFEDDVDVPLADQARVGLARALLETGTPPDEIVGHFIDRMSDRELIGIMESFTNFEREDFEGVRDVRGYVRRMASIAMEGVLQEGPPPGADEAGVTFSAGMGAGNQPESQGDIFGTDAKRIYASFPTYEYDGRSVIAKWYTKNPPNLILFGEYPINTRDETSYVWLERKRGWDPGQYTVEIYSKDAERRLATNHFDISENANQ